MPQLQWPRSQIQASAKAGLRALLTNKLC